MRINLMANKCILLSSSLLSFLLQFLSRWPNRQGWHRGHFAVFATGKTAHIRHARDLPHHLALQPAAAEETRTGKLSHHLAHLDVLLDELVDAGDGCSRSASDSSSTVRSEERRVGKECRSR